MLAVYVSSAKEARIMRHANRNFGETTAVGMQANNIDQKKANHHLPATRGATTNGANGGIEDI
jgi:hypothetical protein